MAKEIVKGVWPVCMTAFNEDNSLDVEGNKQITEWYIQNGAHGLFTACLSSEIFYMTAEQRVELVKIVKAQAAGRVPVIASGTTALSNDMDTQLKEIGKMVSEAQPDAIVLITNGLASNEEGFDVFKKNVDTIINAFPEVTFAAYECPHPFKRVLKDEEVKYLAETGRFAFLKDVCVDVDTYARRAEIVKGTKLMLFNATPATMLKTYQLGYDGYCGPMCNYHMDITRWMFDNWNKETKKAERLQHWTTMYYNTSIPVYMANAKYKLIREGLKMGYLTYYKDGAAMKALNDEEKAWVEIMEDQENVMRKYLGIPEKKIVK